MIRVRWVGIWTVALIGYWFAGCRPQLEREVLLIFAAASLTDVMHEMEAQFETLHSEVDVVVSVGASSLLTRQIEQGAPADVLLSASPVWTGYLDNRFRLRAPARPLVSNHLVVIGQDEVAPLGSLADLKRFERIALADPAHVPAGQYARDGLEQAGLWTDLAEQIVPMLDVRAVVAAVQTGAAPVGIVYASDVRAASGVHVLLDWPEQFAPDIRYTVAVPVTAPHPEHAEAFVAFIRAAEREVVWQRFGFGPRDEVRP